MLRWLTEWNIGVLWLVHFVGLHSKEVVCLYRETMTSAFKLFIEYNLENRLIFSKVIGYRDISFSKNKLSDRYKLTKISLTSFSVSFLIQNMSFSAGNICVLKQLINYIVFQNKRENVCYTCIGIVTWSMIVFEHFSDSYNLTAIKFRSKNENKIVRAIIFTPPLLTNFFLIKEKQQLSHAKKKSRRFNDEKFLLKTRRVWANNFNSSKFTHSPRLF